MHGGLMRPEPGPRTVDEQHVTQARLRATARVTQCERRAWRAQEAVHLADVMLRRALRSAADAAAELDDATRHLDRIAAPDPLS